MGDEHAAIITIGIIVVFAFLAGVLVGLTQSASFYEKGYLTEEGNNTKYCIPSGWVEVDNPNQSPPQNTMTFKNPEQFCLHPGDTIELNFELEMGENGLQQTGDVE